MICGNENPMNGATQQENGEKVTVDNLWKLLQNNNGKNGEQRAPIGTMTPRRDGSRNSAKKPSAERQQRYA